MGSAKRPIGDCLEGLVQMLSPLFVQRIYPAGSFLVKQVSIPTPAIAMTVGLIITIQRCHCSTSCCEMATIAPCSQALLVVTFLDLREGMFCLYCQHWHLHEAGMSSQLIRHASLKVCMHCV